MLTGIGLLVFMHIAHELREQELTAIDTSILTMMRQHQSPSLTTTAIVLSDMLYWNVAILLLTPFVIYLWVVRRWLTAVILVAVPLLSNLLVVVLKDLFQRHRPLTALIPEVGKSFPSGHATISPVLYGLLGYIVWRYLVKSAWSRLLVVSFTVCLVLGTGLARIYLNVHYPSDVLAGWAVGSCILFGTIVLLERLAQRESGHGDGNLPVQE